MEGEMKTMDEIKPIKKTVFGHWSASREDAEQYELNGFLRRRSWLIEQLRVRNLNES